MIALLKRYPRLAATLPYVSLGEFPTPVQRLECLGKAIGVEQLYIKRDDISGRLYGGNKVRKLEFLLGDALSRNYKGVLTFGGVGSNHALATAIYARQLGLKCISVLVNQPNACSVRRNILLSHHYGAELHLVPTKLDSPLTMPLVRATKTARVLRQRLSDGHPPLVIPAGGSSPTGVIGFVNAALELEEQVKKGGIPEPDYIYVAAGTMGTAAGLTLGLRATGLKTRVVSIRVTGRDFVNAPAMLALLDRTNALLSAKDSGFPRYDFSAGDIGIRDEFYGRQYALYTPEGMAAVALIGEKEGIKLDGTYTGKALAAIIRDAPEQGLRGKVVLFWNTLNSRDFSDVLGGMDYRDLPRGFRRYFEEDVQPLDRRDEKTSCV